MRFRVRDRRRELEVSEEEVLALLYDPDRDLRRDGSAAMTKGLQQNAHPLAFIFNTLVQDKAVEDRLRSYERPDRRTQPRQRDRRRERRPRCSTRASRATRSSHATTRSRRGCSGSTSLEDYDRYAPRPGRRGRARFDEARADRPVDAYGDFAPQMADIAGDASSTSHWIDAELRAGKRGGAFSASTVPSAHPYVMLNYTGNLRDVMTVAHELGHGVHQYLARRPRGLFEQDTPLTTAETASVFGEMLVFRRLMAGGERPEDPARAPVREARGRLRHGLPPGGHDALRAEPARRREEEGELPIDRVNELWLDANRPMFGDSVRLSDDYGWWWLYIPHFVHTPFYCYAYAFGELLVLALLRRYDEEGDAFVPRYLELLAAGGSDTPENLLSRIGLDVTDPSFWDGGLALLEDLVAEAEALAG